MLRSIARPRPREPLLAAARPALAALRRRDHDATAAPLGPVLILLLVLSIVLWAIGEHARQRAVLQELETRRYVAQFTEGPVARARARLDAARHEDLARAALVVAPAAPAPDDGMARAVRPGEDVESVLRFYRRLALCIRMGSCDRDAAAAWFGELPWRFRDRYRRHLHAAYPNEDLDAVFSTMSPRDGID